MFIKIYLNTIQQNLQRTFVILLQKLLLIKNKFITIAKYLQAVSVFTQYQQIAKKNR